MKVFTWIALFATAVMGQNAGSQTAEFHPPMPIKKCTAASGCSDEDTKVVIDSNWRWTHKVGTTDNCYTDNTWDASVCPTTEAGVDTCTADCAIDGVDAATWESTYGAIAKNGHLNLSFVTEGPYSRNVGSRTYLMEDDTKYKMFNLMNAEFTFDVDVSNMPCGLNGALYFVEMDADGGLSKYADKNKAGAKYGTGYCDAQCPHDLKWINGEANVIDWKPSKSDQNAGTGKFGTCCAELDIWEANKISTQMTVHSCTTEGQYRCNGTECGDNASGERFKGVCDKDGCDFNPYRVGDTQFFGPGPDFKVNTLKPFTVVTQFITTDGTATGDLKEMRRFYVQDGKKIENANTGAMYGSYDSISDQQCVEQKKLFTDVDYFSKVGGIKAMGEAMKRGMVLVMSMWDDHDASMIWLDATDPYPIPSGKKGAPRGTCDQASGTAATVEKAHPHANVKFGNVRYGEIGSTTNVSPTPGPSPAPSPSPSDCPGASLSACISMCPSAIFETCVNECVQRCPNRLVERP